MRRCPRILLVTPTVRPETGVGGVVLRLAEALRSRQVPLRIIDTEEGGSGRDHLPLMATSPRRLLAGLAAAAGLGLRRVDVVHVHHRRLLVWFRILRWLGGHRFGLLLTVHSTARPSRVVRAFLPPLTAAVGRGVADSLRSTGYRGRIAVVGNPVPRASRSADPDRGLVTVVARLDRLKDVDCLLAAWALLPPSLADVRLQVAGDGPEAEALKARAGALGVADRVRFLGRRDDVADLIARSAFTVLPSRLEGLPLVVLEAAALGRATLMTGIPGCRECLPADARLPNLVVPGDPRGLASALAAWLAPGADVAEEGLRFQRHLARAGDPDRVARRMIVLFRRIGAQART